MYCTWWPQGQVHAPQRCQVNNYGASVRAKLNRIEKQFSRAPYANPPFVEDVARSLYLL